MKSGCDSGVTWIPDFWITKSNAVLKLDSYGNYSFKFSLSWVSLSLKYFLTVIAAAANN